MTAIKILTVMPVKTVIMGTTVITGIMDITLTGYKTDRVFCCKTYLLKSSFFSPLFLCQSNFGNQPFLPLSCFLSLSQK